MLTVERCSFLHIPHVEWSKRRRNLVYKNLSDDILIQRSFKARLFHAVLFELIAILLTALFFTIIMQTNMFNMGILSVIISLIATLWNGIFNYFFDRLQKYFDFSRTRQIRILHALCFEGGLAFFTIPVVALYLHTGLWQAFWLEAGLLLFFLPYSIGFNYIYDRLYVWLVKGQAQDNRQSR